MGIFSFFSRPDEDTSGSYCDTESKFHLDYVEGDEIDEEIDSSEERGDSVKFGEADFHDEAVNNRHDENGRQVKHGPKRKS